MKRLPVQSSRMTYPVVVGADVLAQTGEQLQEIGIKTGTKIAIITDTTVAHLPFVNQLTESLESAGYPFQTLVVPAGDASKSLDVAYGLYQDLISFGMRRQDVVLALGGGVVGDLAGFVAATYLRGVPFIQAPTTLLSHDSSIGGKVGINLPQGKNLIGAFYPPRAVLYDLNTLSYLPERQWVNGMAEVIKHGIIADANLFETLAANPLTVCPPADELEPILTAAMRVKIDVVEGDEREANLRQVLNLGHTIGHAIEQRSNYSLGHGEAIAIGMALEARLAEKRGLLTAAHRTLITSVLAAHGLPTQAPADDWHEIKKLIEVDKKHKSDAWTFILPTAIGQVQIVNDIRPQEVEDVVRESMKGV